MKNMSRLSIAVLLVLAAAASAAAQGILDVVVSVPDAAGNTVAEILETLGQNPATPFEVKLEGDPDLGKIYESAIEAQPLKEAVARLLLHAGNVTGRFKVDTVGTTNVLTIREAGTAQPPAVPAASKLHFQKADKDQALDVLAAEYDVQIVRDNPVSGPVTTSDLKGKPINEALSAVLALGYTWYMDASGVYHVKVVANQAQPQPAPNTAPVVAQAVQNGQTPEMLAFCQAYNCTGMRPDQIASSMAWDAQRRAGQARWAAQQIASFGYSDGYSGYADRSVQVGNLPYSTGYGYWQQYPGYIDPYWSRFFAEEKNRKIYGIMKIDGPDRQHRNVRVDINDRGKGVASKYDQAHNGVIVVRVKLDPNDPEVLEQKIQFYKEEKKGIRRVTRFLQIEPFEVTGYKNMHWERVDNDTFRYAEFTDPILQQRTPAEDEGNSRSVVGPQTREKEGPKQ